MDREEEKLNWSALEYDEKERSKDWFWALGVIVVTSSIASIIFENYFFAVLLILSGLLLGFFAKKKPEMIEYELNEKGLKVRGQVYPYENIKSFWVQIDPSGEGKLKPVLFIHSERVFSPIISIPIQENIASQVHSFFSEKKVEEVEMQEHISEKIMEILGF